MLTRENLLEHLLTVNEPKLERSLVELNLIRDVMVKQGQVSLTLVLLADDQEDQKKSMMREIEQIALKNGAAKVHIRSRVISDFERNELEQKLNSGSDQADERTNLLEQPGDVKFIAIASGKGGVGKSTVTVNLAVALARQGKKVGVIDADIYGFSVPDMMGIEERPQLKEKTIIPVERFGVKVISMGFFVEDNTPVIWRGPMLGKMLRNFFQEVEWGELDYLLLDLPPGTGDIALDVHQLLPTSKEIIVTTPHATAAFVAARAGAMALHTDHEIIGVVENMAYYQCNNCDEKEYVFGRGGGAKLAEELHTELLAQIPLGAPDNHPSEPDFSPSIYRKESTVGRMYADLAKRVIERA